MQPYAIGKLLRLLCALGVTCGLAACGSTPRPGTLKVYQPGPGASQEFLASTNLISASEVTVEIFNQAGQACGTYVPTVEDGRFTLLIADQPPGSFEAIIHAPSCLPLMTRIVTGVPVTSTHLHFRFGDVDGDGLITTRDVAILKRWKGKTLAHIYKAIADEPVLPLHADWNGDGRITQVEISEAEKNLFQSTHKSSKG